MGVHPKEVLKQIMQMKNDGVQDGEEEEEEEEEEENPYGDEVASQQLDARDEQLRMEKELFKQQMGLSDKKKQPSQAKE